MHECDRVGERVKEKADRRYLEADSPRRLTGLAADRTHEWLVNEREADVLSIEGRQAGRR